MSTNKSIALGVVAWLENQKVEGLEDAVKAIEKGFDLQASDFLECAYFPTELDAIFKAGVEKLDLKTAGENLEEAKRYEH